MSSDRRNCPAQVRSFDAGSFARCPRCQGWLDRSDPLAVAEHRGPLPHPVPDPRTAWADEDDEAC
jgi:Zn-finger nucleic acid-binding protein